MSKESFVHIVDDDADVRESLKALLQTEGYNVNDYASAQAFLSIYPTQDGCVVADIRMPDMDGLALQEELARRSIRLPVIIVTGHGDVQAAVRAMKAGAQDFIEKPFSDELILASVAKAIAFGQRTRDKAAEAKSAQGLLDSLTPREREVLDKIVAGRSNKVAAYELGISPRTIEIHRAHIMNKMDARSLSDLVRVSLAASSWR